MLRKNKHLICIVLIFTQLGCSSYRFRCTSEPSGATVVVGGWPRAETPCRIEVPADSPLISENKLELVFAFLDGRQKSVIIDVSDMDPVNPLIEITSSIFGVVGFLFLWASQPDDDDDDHYRRHDDDENFADRLSNGLIGIGSLIAGSALNSIMSTDPDCTRGYPVHVVFDSVDELESSDMNKDY
jgi:hypothetical protein